jgi:hypothetical protein
LWDEDLGVENFTAEAYDPPMPILLLALNSKPLNLIMDRLWLQVHQHCEEAWVGNLAAGAGRDQGKEALPCHCQKRRQRDAQVSTCRIHDDAIIDKILVNKI